MPNLNQVFHDACSHHVALGFNSLQLGFIWIPFGFRLVIVNCTQWDPLGLQWDSVGIRPYYCELDSVGLRWDSVGTRVELSPIQFYYKLLRNGTGFTV